jgi:hypothetical protein
LNDFKDLAVIVTAGKRRRRYGKEALADKGRKAIAEAARCAF